MLSLHFEGGAEHRACWWPVPPQALPCTIIVLDGCRWPSTTTVHLEGWQTWLGIHRTSQKSCGLGYAHLPQKCPAQRDESTKPEVSGGRGETRGWGAASAPLGGGAQ